MKEKMPELIDGFSQVEYLIVFNTILFGVIASEYFSGWGGLVRHRDTVKKNWLHIAWSIYAFLTLIQNWYGIWPRVQFINDNILFFIWALVPMFIFHLISVVLFPSQKYIETTDFGVHFEKNTRILYLLFAIYYLTTIAGSFIYADKGDVLQQNLIRSFGVALSLLGVVLHKKKWIHYMFLIIGYLALAKFILAIPT